MLLISTIVAHDDFVLLVVAIAVLLRSIIVFVSKEMMMMSLYLFLKSSSKEGKDKCRIESKAPSLHSSVPKLALINVNTLSTPCHNSNTLLSLNNRTTILNCSVIVPSPV